MTIDVQTPDRIEMNQKERDVLTIMRPVLSGERTQVEAARLLGISVRQVRRIYRKLQEHGDQAVVHGLRGQPSNHTSDPELRRAVLEAYRNRYAGFGPTLACEKLQGEELVVSTETLRRWLIQEELWQRQRRRDPHRSRRPRRDCFGELVQMDASIHNWLEGRGEEVVLISMIDDATSRQISRFYHSATVGTHMDLVGRWLGCYGRPLALYTDRHSIFMPQDKGRQLPDAKTQFGRALAELGIELILARSPQAKGRVERNFNTTQDRWVKEMRLAGVTTCDGANELLDGGLLAEHNRRFSKPARLASDAHRPLGPGHKLPAILSIQEQRVVGNDYTIRFQNRIYQLLPPPLPGLRKGTVVIEMRLDGSMEIRFGERYLKWEKVEGGACPGGSAPRPPEFNASTADARGEEDPTPSTRVGPTGMQPTVGRSGRTPAEPYPPDGSEEDSDAPDKGPDQSQSSKPEAKSPGKDHPWRKPFKQQK